MKKDYNHLRNRETFYPATGEEGQILVRSFGALCDSEGKI